MNVCYIGRSLQNMGVNHFLLTTSNVDDSREHFDLTALSIYKILSTRPLWAKELFLFKPRTGEPKERHRCRYVVS